MQSHLCVGHTSVKYTKYTVEYMRVTLTKQQSLRCEDVVNVNVAFKSCFIGRCLATGPFNGQINTVVCLAAFVVFEAHSGVLCAWLFEFMTYCPALSRH